MNLSNLALIQTVHSKSIYIHNCCALIIILQDKIIQVFSIIYSNMIQIISKTGKIIYNIIVKFIGYKVFFL